MLFEKYQAELNDWMKANPGMLFKAGGKSKSSNRQHDTTHYDRKYFDTDSAYLYVSWHPHRQSTGKQGGSSSS